MRVLLAAFLAALGIAACGEDPAAPPSPPVPAPTPVRHFFHGMYAGQSASQRGSMVMDLVQVGNRVTGEFVSGSHLFPDRNVFLFVLGHVDRDTLWLGPDTTRFSYPPDRLTFKGVMTADGKLSSDFHIPEIRLTAHAELDSAGVGTVTLELQRGKGETLHGLAFDGIHVWAGTSMRGFPRYDLDGTYVDRVNVELYPGVGWTSDVLAANDTLLYGHLPVWEVYSNVTYSISDIIAFDKSGTIVSRYRIRHRTTGLTHDGTNLWSLSTESDTLYALDRDGAVLEEIPLSVPDFVAVEYDGTDFWFVGWHLPVLYRMSRTGEMLGVWDFPEVNGWHPMFGLAWDGNYWWATRDDYPGTIMYRFTALP